MEVTLVPFGETLLDQTFLLSLFLFCQRLRVINLLLRKLLIGLTRLKVLIRTIRERGFQVVFLAVPCGLLVLKLG